VIAKWEELTSRTIFYLPRRGLDRKGRENPLVFPECKPLQEDGKELVFRERGSIWEGRKKKSEREKNLVTVGWKGKSPRHERKA